jgi:dTDP-D-glucose 4,6-dehydratase
MKIIVTGGAGFIGGRTYNIGGNNEMQNIEVVDTGLA